MRTARLASFLPLLPALALLLALLAMVPNDPATGFTISGSPFSDEGFDLLNARNQVLFGSWSTGDWNLHLVNGPFSAAMAGVFSLFGVGMVPARVLMALVSAASVAALGVMVAARFGHRFGHWAGFVAALGVAANALVLYYGRLAFLEPLVTFFLVAGAALLALAPYRASFALGLAGGALLGLAIATKANAGFAVVGLLVGMTLAGSFRDPRTRRRVGGAAAGILLVGAGWLLVVALPNWSAVVADLKIWAQPAGPVDAAELLVRLAKYPRESDGAVAFSLMLLIAAVAGAVYARRRWRTYDRGLRLLIGGAAGWFAAGTFVLMAVDYRPNRYAVPLLPALAVLAAVAAWELAWMLRRDGAARVAAMAVLSIGLVVPGAVAYTGWAASASQQGLALQAALVRQIPPGEGVEGELAPMLALTTRSSIFVSRPADGIDEGDLRTERNVRWVIVRPGQAPAWVNPVAWARSSVASCFDWGGRRQCLVRIP